MIFEAFPESNIISGNLERSEDTIVIIETSIAISLPLPIAILISASANAALSFIPSPTIATFLPDFCN